MLSPPGPRFNHWLGNKDPQAAWCDQKKDVFESYNNQNCTCNRIRREINEIQIYLSMYKQSVYDKCGIPNHWIIQLEKSI